MLRLPQKTRLIILGGVLLILVLILVLIVLGVVSCIKGCTAEASVADGGNYTVLQTQNPVQNSNGISNTQAPIPTDSEGQPLDTQEPVYTSEPTATPFPVMQKRDRSEEVTNLQTRLMELGYLDIDETTDYFGGGTEYAVKLFQRQHLLEMDGIVGAQTYSLLFSYDAEPYVLKEGAEGKDVKTVQERLEEMGYLTSSQVDGIYGQVTIDAVKAFQKRNKLTQDGKAGEKTLDKLYSDDAKISSELEKKLKEEEKNKKDDKDDDKTTATTKIDKFIKAAKSKLGCEYVLGDKGPDTFDCSGFVYYCLRQAGVSCSRLNAAGFSNKTSWKKITSVGDLKKGDILFFRSDDSARVSHCGIYIGSGMMIDASSGNGEVIKRAVSSYWKRNFVCARRPW